MNFFCFSSDYFDCSEVQSSEPFSELSPTAGIETVIPISVSPPASATCNIPVFL